MKRYTFQSRPKELQEADVRVTTELSKESSRSLEEILSLDADTSSEFIQIKRFVYPLSSSLPLLIYNLKPIVEICLRHISICPHSVLAILQAIAREVRQELTPFFQEILLSFIQLTQQNHLLEEIFSCISILLKYLIKNIDPESILVTVAPLISHKDAGIRHLSAQSFSFLIRKNINILKKVLADLGEPAWELGKYSVNNFSVNEVLEASWVHVGAARLIHLSLAAERKYDEAVWESIVNSGNLTVLRDWAIMCNGNLFPYKYVDELVWILKENCDSISLSLVAKYRSSVSSCIDWILQQPNAFECLCLLSDYEDPHLEEEIHEKVMKKAYKNRAPIIDFSQCTESLYTLINSLLINPKKPLHVLVHTIHKHTTKPSFLPNLLKAIESSEDNFTVWLGLRLLRYSGAKVIPKLLVSDEFILREYAAITQILPNLQGEVLWTAAEMYPEGLEGAEKLDRNLLHPILRVPTAALMQGLNSFMRIAWETVRDPANIENERHIITNLKRLDHLFSESPRSACLFLIGLFYERFSTIWRHIITSLVLFGKSYPEILWQEFINLLIHPPTDTNYPQYYMDYCNIRDTTPANYLQKNIIEVLILSPPIVHEHITEFTEVFLRFFQEEYLLSTWLPTFNVSNQYSGNKPNSRLCLFLKVFNAAKNIEKVEQKALLRKILVGLCCDKNEEIRCLASEALINIRDEEFLVKDLLRKLAKDESFREGILEIKSLSTEAQVALCAARVFNKSSFAVGALNYISSLPKGEFLLELLPIQFARDSPASVFEIPNQLAIMFLRNLKKIISHAFPLIRDPDQLLQFLIKLYNYSKDKHREISGKSIACINLAIGRNQYSDLMIKEVMAMISPIIPTFAHDIRPKVVDLLCSMALKYEVLHDNPEISEGLFKLLLNAKIETKMALKALEVLNLLPFSTSESCIPALLAAFSHVNCAPCLLGVLKTLEPSTDITPIAQKLIPNCNKRPDIKEILLKWLPFCTPAPIPELSTLVLKHEDAIPLLALCLEDPDKDILLKLSATRKRGLDIERCYDIQLQALHDISDTCFNHPRAILNALSHYLISDDLGIRTAAGSSILSFVSLNGIEDVLSACIQKSKDEEQIRSIIKVWNALETPLSSQDPEKSFLLNLVHLQIHRRVRAMNSLPEFPVYFSKKLIIPLLNFYLLYSTSKQNYQSSFIHNVIIALAEQASRLTWRGYYKLIRLYMKNAEHEERISVKTVCCILAKVPQCENCAPEVLMNKVLPKLKSQLCDKKDKKRPKVRKHVAVGIFRVIQLQKPQESSTELARLLLILSKQYKTNDEDSRDSIIKAVAELLKAGCSQHTLLKEFNHGLDSELFSHFLTRILKTQLLKMTEQELPIIHQSLLEYEQYSSYYYLAKSIEAKLLPSLFASSKALQYISQGLCENPNISAEDYLSLGLSLLTQQRPYHKEEPTHIPQLKLTTFTIQSGAAEGTRPRSEPLTTKISAEKVFGIRLLKIGVKKSEDMHPDTMKLCENAAIQCLTVKKDEVVIGALEILKVVGNSSIINEVIKVSERAGEEVTIHCLKTVAALIRCKSEAEDVAGVLLPQVIFALQSNEVQSSALKILKVFIGFVVMHELIYDAMEEIPRIIVTNSNLAGQVCRLYTQFLLSYPLSEKRKGFHIDFLVKNLSGVSKQAGEGILQALEVILDKFPFEELKDYYDFLLLSIVTAVCNEDIEDYRERYLRIAEKITRLNPNSSVLEKIFTWISSNNKKLSEGCIRYAAICLKEKLANKKTLKLQVLPRILESPISKLTLNFLVAWHRLYSGMIKEITSQIECSLSRGEDLTEEIAASLQECSEKTLEIALKAIENNTFIQGINNLISKASGPLATRKVSAVARKLFGRGLEDTRVLQLLTSLLTIITEGEYDRKALIKTLLVFSRSNNNEIKEIIQDILKELHVGKTQEEFLKEYSSVKDKMQMAKDKKKSDLKIMMVAQPDVAARLKQKKLKKSRLLKKQKLIRLNPYKRIKVESLVVSTKD